MNSLMFLVLYKMSQLKLQFLNKYLRNMTRDQREAKIKLELISRVSGREQKENKNEKYEFEKK